MTTRIRNECSTKSWLSRILLQHLTAASLRTMSSAGSRASRRALRTYFATLSVTFVAFALSACSDAAAPTNPPAPAPVASVHVAPDTLQLEIGEVRQLAASPRDAQGQPLMRSVAWRSADATIATVDATGAVRALAGGTVMIMASAEGKEGSAKVVIRANPVELEISRPGIQFNGIASVMTPEPQSVNVTSKNGVATGLTAVIEYGTGVPAGWLTASLSANTTPATLTVNAQTGALLPGSYTARVDVRTASGPDLPPRMVDVMFTVKPGPQMDVSTSDRHNCALDLNGQVFCWGYNGSRQLGTGSQVSHETRAVLVSGERKFLTMTTGELHGCGITADAQAYCWGTGYMGDGAGAVVGVTPRAVTGANSYTTLAAGYRHTCGLAINGDAYCWGDNNGGQVGNGTRVAQGQPVKVSGGLAFTAVTAGEEHTCGLTANGDAYCWGRTAYGRLGQTVNSTDAAMAPLKVPGGMQWAAIDAGRYHTCAIDRNGVAYCWGYNGNGQLGDESRTSRSVPTPVATSVRFSAISAGNAHSCGIATNGQAYCWGLRSPGAVGDGVKDGYVLAPAQALGGITFKRIAAGNAHSCAISTADATYCWGYNANGAIGDGTTIDRLQPVSIRLQ